MNNTIIIGGDLVPTESNYELFKDGDAKKLIGEELLEKLNNAAFTIFNLEVPLTDEWHPIAKCGPNLIAPIATIKGLKAINPHFFGLANNHILDQGVEGLESTVKVLEDAGIEYSGVGQNLDEASKPFIKEINGKRIGIYCCAEHEFSIATKFTPGANPFDPLVSFDDVKALKNKSDSIIVLYHGGKEHYRYPSPQLQRVFRKFADCGADIVVAQHTHCIGCMEEYKGCTLIYGQGNFLFDNSDSEYWKTSLLIEFDILSKKTVFIPIEKYGSKVRVADGDKTTILDDFNTRSREISTVGFVQSRYSEFANEMKTEYYLRFSGTVKKNPFVRLMDKLTSYRFIQGFYNDDSRIIIQNILDCEAHRELASEIMRIDK